MQWKVSQQLSVPPDLSVTSIFPCRSSAPWAPSLSTAFPPFYEHCLTGTKGKMVLRMNPTNTDQEQAINQKGMFLPVRTMAFLFKKHKISYMTSRPFWPSTRTPGRCFRALLICSRYHIWSTLPFLAVTCWKFTHVLISGFVGSEYKGLRSPSCLLLSFVISPVHTQTKAVVGPEWRAEMF